jgi:ribonuclease BN (tRNA processing enzyme)
MRLTILGRSPASPNPGEACAGYLVEGGSARVLVDIGPGVVAQLVRRHHPDELDAVIISHMHADHMLDLVTLRYVYPWRERPADQRLRVFLPPGSADQVLDLAKGVGNAKHFEACFRLAEHDGSSSLTFDGLTMTPVETQHYIPCWGFRAEADGRRLAYTADTAPCGGLTDLADRADLLLSEATLKSLDEDAAPPEPRGHITPAEAGEAAREGGSRRLMLTHLPVNGDGSWARTTATESFAADVEIAEPSTTYEI